MVDEQYHLRLVAILPRLLAHLPVLDMRNLRLCNSACNTAVASMLNRKLDRLLSHYVSNSAALRDLIRETQSIICGSSALEFVLHGTDLVPTTPADLDISTTPLHALTLVRHLCAAEAYLVLPISRPDKTDRVFDYRPGVVSTQRLVHAVHGRIVDVTCSTRLISMHPLVYCPHTLLMNYLTADGFVVAYPFLTFEGTGVDTNVLLDSPSAAEYQAKVANWLRPRLSSQGSSVSTTQLSTVLH